MCWAVHHHRLRLRLDRLERSGSSRSHLRGCTTLANPDTQYPGWSTISADEGRSSGAFSSWKAPSLRSGRVQLKTSFLYPRVRTAPVSMSNKCFRELGAAFGSSEAEFRRVVEFPFRGCGSFGRTKGCRVGLWASGDRRKERRPRIRTPAHDHTHTNTEHTHLR